MNWQETKTRIPYQKAKSDKDLAEEFTQFFLNKIDNIREQFLHHPTTSITKMCLN